MEHDKSWSKEQVMQSQNIFGQEAGYVTDC